ncbi:MAG: hypothetical protein WCK73_11360, partial [Deltaproteobacteria bacterium]
ERAGEAALDAAATDDAGPQPADPSPTAATGPSGTPLLARAVERIALLVQTGDAPAVTVQLGPSLDVRIEQARDGVEVALQVAHGLSPMGEAELPLLVAALRARGVRVSRAGVLARRRDGRASLTPSRSSATNGADDGTVAKW